MIVIEASDEDVVEIGHICSEDNLAHVVTRTFNGPKLRALTREQLSRTSDSGECQRAMLWPI